MRAEYRDRSFGGASSSRHKPAARNHMRAFVITTCSLALADASRCTPLSHALTECSRVTQLQRQTQRERETQLGTRVSRESSVTVLWGRDDWERHVGSTRYLRALFNWPYSTVLRGLAPELLMLLLWSCLAWWRRWTLTSAATGWLASPLALLLAFRVNAAVSRFNEGRVLWGRVIWASRDLALMLAASPRVPPATRDMCCRLLVSFGWATKATVRTEGSTVLNLVLETLLPPDALQAVTTARKPPLALLALLRRATVRLALPQAQMATVQDRISELTLCFGGMERILSTPLSPTYQRHMSRGIMLWLLLLPLGLIGAGCTTLLKLCLVEVAIAYVMLGIDEIGIQIEQPFDVLPLHALATGISNDVGDQLAAAA